MLVVYMPIIRDAAHSYVELWNHHQIRKQPNRPNAVTGQPILLYHYPPSGIESYEVPIDQNYMAQVEASLEEWGMCYHFIFLSVTPLSTTLLSYDKVIY